MESGLIRNLGTRSGLRVPHYRFEASSHTRKSESYVLQPIVACPLARGWLITQSGTCLDSLLRPFHSRNKVLVLFITISLNCLSSRSDSLAIYFLALLRTTTAGRDWHTVASSLLLSDRLFDPESAPRTLGVGNDVECAASRCPGFWSAQLSSCLLV